MATVPLDREKEDKYTLVVTANDGIHTTSASVTITISDYNDNSPVFTQSFYSFEVGAMVSGNNDNDHVAVDITY